MNKQVKKCIEKYALPFVKGEPVTLGVNGEYLYKDWEGFPKGTILIKKGCTKLMKIMILLHELKHKRDDERIGITYDNYPFFEKRAYKFELRFLKRYDKKLFNNLVELLQSSIIDTSALHKPYVEYAFRCINVKKNS